MTLQTAKVAPVLEDYYPAQTGNNKGPYQVQTCAAGAEGHMTGSIPANFGSMVQFLVCLIADQNSVADNTAFDIRAGNHGQSILHVNNSGVVVVTYVVDQVKYIDLTSSVPVFSAGDVYGVTLDPADAGLTIHILGTKLVYRPNYPAQ